MLVLNIIFWTVTSNINSKIAAREESDAQVVASKLTDIIESTENYISINIVSLSDPLYRPFFEEVNITSRKYISAFNSLRNSINEFKITQAAISSIYIYAPKSNYVVSTDSSYINGGHFDTFTHKKVFEDYIHKGKSYSINTDSLTPEISIVYPIMISKENTAFVSYNIDLDYLSTISMFKIAMATDENIIYPVIKQDTDTEKFADTSIPFFTDNIKLVFYTNNFSTSIPWYYYLVFMIVVFVFSIAVAYVISSILYYNINTIYLMLYDAFDPGFTQNDTDSYSKQNEYSYILNNINHLIKKNTTMTGTLNENLIKLNNTKVHALSLQMSPHFLFNTLNLINTLALESTEDSKKKIPKVVDLLSQVLSISLSASKPICTLEDEISYTKIYIDIQKYKYEDFDVFWYVPDEFLKLGITKFSLQPIIENAIHHGFAITKKRNINIDCSEEDKFYHITISNSGSVPYNRVTQINNHINQPEMPKQSIGLWNTNQRIKLLFGDNYGLRFFSHNNKTGVDITLPKSFPEENMLFS